jgi:cytochrome P450
MKLTGDHDGSAIPSGCPFHADASDKGAGAATEAPMAAKAARDDNSHAVERPHSGAAGTLSRLAIDFDPLSYATFDNPYDMYRRLRNDAPVFYNPERDLYVVSRYADVRTGLANASQLLSKYGNDIDGGHDSFGPGNLVAEDPPRHTALRAAVRRSFAAREVLTREDHMRQLAQSLLKSMWKKGSGDFATEFAVPMAFGVAMNLAGLPMEHEQELEEHFWRSMERPVGRLGMPESAAAANHETEALLETIFEQHAATLPEDAGATDSRLLTQITVAAQKGKIDKESRYGLAHLVYGAALDAPSALLTIAVTVLDKFRAMQPFLAKNPDWIPQFVEETLRFDAPAQNLSRQSIEEVEFSGVTIPADSRVMFLQGSANRDERIYDKPDEFNIEREFTPANRIMSFGEGAHSCMGNPYARMATRVMLEELTQGPRIHVEGIPQRWAKQMVRGFSSLPVVFD